MNKELIKIVIETEDLTTDQKADIIMAMEGSNNYYPWYVYPQGTVMPLKDNQTAPYYGGDVTISSQSPETEGDPNIETRLTFGSATIPEWAAEFDPFKNADVKRESATQMDTVLEPDMSKMTPEWIQKVQKHLKKEKQNG